MKGRCGVVSLLFGKQRINQKNMLKSLPESMMFPKLILSKAWRLWKETPRRTCCSAVFTLEAAVIFPLLAVFFGSILFFFCVMQVQMEVQQTVNQAARTMAAYGSVSKSEEVNRLADLVGIKLFLQKELKNSDMINRYVSGKTAGISVLKSKTKGDFITVHAEYCVKCPFMLLGKHNIKLVSRTTCRKWTGWHKGKREQSDTWVYITESGTVYHRSRQCSHLKLTIQSVSYAQLSNLRNKNGYKYHKCKLCADKCNNRSRVYITDQGDKYHCRLNCSGLKRTITMIRLSEVGNRPPCSKCGIKQEGEN